MSLTELVGCNQTIGISIFMQQMQRACEVNTDEVVLPTIAIIFVEIITKVQDVIGRYHTFPRQKVNRIGDRSRFG